jgi:hypothetical protein
MHIRTKAIRAIPFTAFSIFYNGYVPNPSFQDLLEYLSQLLADSSPPQVLELFVDNIGRFQRGEKLEFEDNEDQSSKKKVDPTIPATQSKPVSKEKLGSHDARPVPKKQPQKKTATNNIKQQNSQSHLPSKTLKNPPPAAEKSTSIPTISSTEILRKTASNTTTSELSKETEQPRKPSKPPSRGTPKVVCGCFGTKHKPLTNCLFCGRISCTREGYDFCPFCGFQVEEVIKDGV